MSNLTDEQLNAHLQALINQAGPLFVKTGNDFANIWEMDADQMLIHLKNDINGKMRLYSQNELEAPV